MTGLRPCTLLIVLVAILLCATTAPALAQKADIIKLVNGDTLTCEFKTLRRGRLTTDTDDMGTVNIEWDKVVSVASRRIFQFETAGGLAGGQNLDALIGMQ